MNNENIQFLFTLEYVYCKITAIERMNEEIHIKKCVLCFMTMVDYHNT